MELKKSRKRSGKKEENKVPFRKTREQNVLRAKFEIQKKKKKKN